ncbi:MAG TPA: hypothetical protein VHQ64_14500 [Pyrinomonadaceae bacterium]|jgi:hypothetical protein|nr:hypothetical protein [Pyrinomonadaceae bacterium]
MKRTVIIISLGLIGAAALCWVSFGFNKRDKLVPYTIVLKATDYDQRGIGHEAFSEVKYVSAHGNWRSVKSFRSGLALEQYARVGHGIFTVDNKQKKMYFESPYNPASTPQSLTNRNYVRSEIVGGIRTNVLRSGTGDNYAETFLAPELNDDVIKTVLKSPAGTRVIEPVTITRGEPVRGAFQHNEYEIDMTRDKRNLIVRH